MTMSWTICRSMTSLAAALLASADATHAQSTGFTYQGRLTENGQLATGVYDFRFAIFESLSSGTQIGESITNYAVGVSNGGFVTTLDFGPTPWDGSNRWLEI